MFTRPYDIARMFGTANLLRSRMDRMFSDFDRSFVLKSTRAVARPRTRLLDATDHFEVQAEVPGIAIEDLSINIQGNYLEISGKRVKKEPEGYKTHRKEIHDHTFSRSFTLPDDVDADKVTARLKDGVLHLTLPKTEAAKPRQIEIKAAS